MAVLDMIQHYEDANKDNFRQFYSEIIEILTDSRQFPHIWTGIVRRASSMEGAMGEMVRHLAPALSYDLHKGQAGRIGVVGGCKEYTGAPYFAGISAMKVGADLSHIFTTTDAAPIIKSYSPELIVHPLLDLLGSVPKIDEWLRRLHALVLGPGLGRDEEIASTVEGVLKRAKDRDIPLVVDADGMYFLTLNPAPVQNYTKAILTPNAIEFARFFEAVMKRKSSGGENSIEETKALAEALGHVTIVRKGRHDIITDGKEEFHGIPTPAGPGAAGAHCVRDMKKYGTYPVCQHDEGQCPRSFMVKMVLTCEMEACPRRCGGQGDLLSGSMGTFSFWAHHAQKHHVHNPTLQRYGPTLCAAYAACTLTRMCARQAFSKHHRSMMTTDMIDEIAHVFHKHFESS